MHWINSTGHNEKIQTSVLLLQEQEFFFFNKKITELPYLFQQAPIRSISPLNNQQGDILLNGNFWGVVPYEGKYDALGLVTTHYDKRTKQFAMPEYWLNAMLNSQEITHLYPYKTATGTSYVLTTYDGKLILLTK